MVDQTQSEFFLINKVDGKQGQCWQVKFYQATRIHLSSQYDPKLPLVIVGSRALSSTIIITVNQQYSTHLTIGSCPLS